MANAIEHYIAFGGSMAIENDALSLEVLWDSAEECRGVYPLNRSESIFLTFHLESRTCEELCLDARRSARRTSRLNDHNALRGQRA
jgi:hypothetical protein